MSKYIDSSVQDFMEEAFWERYDSDDGDDIFNMCDTCDISSIKDMMYRLLETEIPNNKILQTAIVNSIDIHKLIVYVLMMIKN